MKTRIGYLIPEFPGQTHIFFWREREVLTELGIETDLISTRRPPKAIASHTWAAEAQAQTAYLSPFQTPDLLGAIFQVLKAGPIGWRRCLQLVLTAPDVSLKQQVSPGGYDFGRRQTGLAGQNQTLAAHPRPLLR